jgi:carboxylesterase type B
MNTQSQLGTNVRKIYVFKNIRFGEPPVGPLRWQKPRFPKEPNKNSSYGPACIQGTAFIENQLPDTIKPLLGASGVDLGLSASGATEINEDCLFLDVYVPEKALRATQAKLPVVFWVYGGAYLIGSKEGRYAGQPVVTASEGNVIFVGANYRLGAFGFLAGDTVEKGGVANAALWDQRAVLEWIQKEIFLFGGDPDNVNIWGE